MYKIIAVIIFIFLLFPQQVLAANKPVINEFLAHPSTGNKEWVEIYNPDNVDLTKYWIDDDLDFNSDVGSSPKKSLTTIKAGKDSFHPYVELSSMLNNSGDFVVLFDSSGKIVDQYQYIEDPGEDVTIGRSPDGAGQFFALQDYTQGDINSNPIPTSTPTSAPTLTPTKTPTPTDTPVPTKVPTATKGLTSTLIPTKKLLTVATGFVSPSLTEVLGTTSAIATPSASPTAKKEMAKVNKKNQGNPWNIVFIIIGVLFILACGILVFFKRRMEQIL